MFSAADDELNAPPSVFTQVFLLSADCPARRKSDYPHQHEHSKTCYMSWTAARTILTALPSMPLPADLLGQLCTQMGQAVGNVLWCVTNGHTKPNSMESIRIPVTITGAWQSRTASIGQCPLGVEAYGIVLKSVRILSHLCLAGNHRDTAEIQEYKARLYRPCELWHVYFMEVIDVTEA